MVPLILVWLFLFSTPVWADSLWIEKTFSPHAVPFSDQRPIFVKGGLIMVIVSEEMLASQGASTQTKKESDFNADLGFLIKRDFTPFGVGTPKQKGENKGQNQFSMGFGDNFRGDGITERKGKIAMKITCQIEEILPNGNLIIKGSKKIQVNNEVSDIALSGVIRREDIDPDNSILSSNIAEIKIDIKGKGTVSAKAKPGLMSKLLNWMF